MARVRYSLDFEEIKRSICVLDALTAVGWRPAYQRAKGGRGPCPLHGSKDPRSRSFRFTANQWYCGRCKIGGDVLRLWALIQDQEILEAAYDLCESLGRTPPYR